MEIHVTAVKTTLYRKTSDQSAAMHVKKSVSTADNPTAHAAKNILAHVDNIMSKLKKNMMFLVKNVNQPRVTAAWPASSSLHRACVIQSVARIVKSIPAHTANSASKTRENIMSLVKKVEQLRVTAA